MSSRFLPAHPNLEHLKNQAKDLLKAYRARQPSVVARFRDLMPRIFGALDDRPNPPSLSLRDAQHIIALEYGFSSWSHMRTHIQERENVLMLEMTVEDVKRSPKSRQRVVVLKGKKVSKYLPMWVGPAEGDSIAMKLQSREMPRPMTHDLMDSMIGDLGGMVARVVVSELREDMFVGKIVLQREGTTIERDARPSDAIALAVRTGASIYAEEDVVNRAGVEFDPETGHVISTNWQGPDRSIKEIIRSDSAFSEEAKRILQEAGGHAGRLGHEEITPEDILLALLDDKQGAGGSVMANLGMDFEGAKARLEERAERGDSSSDETPDLSEASRRVIRLAGSEAYMVFQGQVGGGQILLGLVSARDGLASEVLRDGGIEIEAARVAVNEMSDRAE